MIEVIKLLMSGAGGGLIGLVGSWLKAKEENKRFQLETDRIRESQAHEAAMARLRMDATAEEWAGKAFDSSQTSAIPSDRTPEWALAVLAMVRPLLTLTLIGFAVYAYANTPEYANRLDLARDAFALCGMAVGWWFGSRPSLRTAHAPVRANSAVNGG